MSKQKKLDTLFNLVIDALISEIESGQADPSMISSAIKLLKDSGFSGDINEFEGLKILNNALPFPVLTQEELDA